MKTATIADLQNNFSTISAWLDCGETVQILREGEPYARLTALNRNEEVPSSKTKPDIMAQLHVIWGDRPFSEKEVQEMRQAELDE